MTILPIRNKAQRLDKATISAAPNRLKISHKTQSERSRNSTAFRSFVRVWRQIRKKDHFELFSSSKRQQEQENRGINQQSKETATVCTVSSAALEVKGTVDPSQ
jgi:hypothetical protein